MSTKKKRRPKRDRTRMEVILVVNGKGVVLDFPNSQEWNLQMFMVMATMGFKRYGIKRGMEILRRDAIQHENVDRIQLDLDYEDHS